MLNDAQIERYSRQIILPQVGGLGQLRLLASSVTLFGDSSLARLLALYLASAGVGKLAVPAGLARETAVQNQDCQVTTDDGHEVNSPMIAACDLVVAADPTTLEMAELNTACVRRHTPLLWGEVDGHVGRTGVFRGYGAHAPCHACFAATGEKAVGAVGQWLTPCCAGVIAGVMATETVKLLLGQEETVAGTIFTFDLKQGSVTPTSVTKRFDCLVCAAHAVQ